MEKVLEDLITNLNMIEVKGKQNLALLYNAIDIATQLKEASTKMGEVAVEEVNEDVADDAE